MKALLSTIIGMVISLTVYSQRDTLVRTNNNRIACTVVEITPHSVIIETLQTDTVKRIEIGQQLIAYIKYANGETQKFRYNKWQLKTNTNHLFKNGFYFDVQTGYCHYRRTGWDTDPTTKQLHFSDERKDFPRIGFSLGNRWLVYKGDSYGLSIGVKWINLSFSPDKFVFPGTILYTDWIFTASPFNPEFTNIYLLNKSSALEYSIGGGFMYHLGESTNGFCLDNSLKFRYHKLAVGLGYYYGRTKDGGYGFPITLNIVNLTVGMKF